ncbi:MAG: hypothetical protein IJ057_11885 [Bacteroidales bacterium]|nr:hypothetical protein [Bacteroidales bacterium]
MKKKIMKITIALMLLTAPMKAQVFIMDDDDWYSNRAQTDNSLIVNNPTVYSSGEDWFAPLEGGAMLLFGFVGAYLLKKRKRS